MKIKPEVFKRTLDRAADDILQASNEHPETKDAEVKKIVITVHYKDTTAKTVCDIPPLLRLTDLNEGAKPNE